ncbi:MAG TPA: hypothetical protein VIT62_12000 [Lysobacter sp.]
MSISVERRRSEVCGRQKSSRTFAQIGLCDAKPECLDAPFVRGGSDDEVEPIDPVEAIVRAHRELRVRQFPVSQTP